MHLAAQRPLARLRDGLSDGRGRIPFTECPNPNRVVRGLRTIGLESGSDVGGFDEGD